MIWPLHSAQPLGGKPKPNARISPRNGELISPPVRFVYPEFSGSKRIYNYNPYAKPLGITHRTDRFEPSGITQVVHCGAAETRAK
jgi:hypothetical protein